MDQKTLKQILTYDPCTGLFTYNINLPPRGKVGCVAGYDSGAGYIRLSLYGKKYYAHRLAFVWMAGEYPKVVDHINGICNDNRWVNLRNVTQKENSSNRLKGNGVRLKHNRWYARYSTVHLGVFDNKEDAVKAYLQAKERCAGVNPKKVRENQTAKQYEKKWTHTQRLYYGKNISFWAKTLNIPQPTLYYRLVVKKLTFENAIKINRTTKYQGELRCSCRQDG
jgi:hypothetical protein